MKVIVSILALWHGIILTSPVSITLTTQDSARALVGERAIDFEIENQFGDKVTFQFPVEKPVIIGFTDREARKDLSKWFKEIAGVDSAKVIDKYVVVSLSSWIPFFARGSIRSSFQDKHDFPYLLDWGGELSKKYLCRAGEPKVILISPEGIIECTVSGLFSEPKMMGLRQRISRYLAGH